MAWQGRAGHGRAAQGRYPDTPPYLAYCWPLGGGGGGPVLPCVPVSSCPKSMSWHPTLVVRAARLRSHPDMSIPAMQRPMTPRAKDCGNSSCPLSWDEGHSVIFYFFFMVLPSVENTTLGIVRGCFLQTTHVLSAKQGR